jgi:hypothetical protein
MGAELDALTCPLLPGSSCSLANPKSRKINWNSGQAEPASSRGTETAESQESWIRTRFLFEVEKGKNEALAQSQDQLHQLLEEDKQKDVVIVHSFKANSRKALEQDIVKMQNTLNEVNKSSSHTRLRFSGQASNLLDYL